MKKYILFIVLLIFVLIESNAQCVLTNPDLENWTGSSASGWTAYYDFLRAASSKPLSVSKSTSFESGSFAASLTLNSTMAPYDKYSDFISSNKSCTEQPISFKGYYSFTPSAGDSLVLLIAVSSSQLAALSDTATASGYGVLVITAATSGYTSFNVPVVYRNTNPTNYVSVGALMVKHTSSTSALLDNFSITYPTTTAVTEATNTQISLINDLNKEEIIFSNIQEKAMLEVYNMAGTKIAEKTLTEGDTALNIGTFRSGLYLAKVSMNDTQTTLKFLK